MTDEASPDPSTADIHSADGAIFDTAMAGMAWGDLGPPQTPEDREFYRRMLLFGYGVLTLIAAMGNVWLFSETRRRALQDPMNVMNAKQLTGSLTLMAFFCFPIMTLVMANAWRWVIRLPLTLLLPSVLLGLAFVESKIPSTGLRNMLETITAFGYAVLSVFICRNFKQPE